MIHTARQVHLVSRPEGMPKAENFELREVPLAPPANGQVRVENLFMSVDPYMRGRMRAEKSYAEPYKVGEVMYGGAVGRVAESNSALRAGDIVLSNFGWRDSFVADASQVNRIEPLDPERLSLYLGTLGMPGLTAYVGLLRFCEPKQGDTVFVSAASGAVGANVCQIARLKGCRVVASVGSEDKAEWLRRECRVETVINYRTCGDLTQALTQAAPQGIDCYFENVGGEHLQAAIANMNPFGRIAACGMIGTYNDTTPQPGPNNLMLIVGKKLRITGFIVSDHLDMRPAFLQDMEQWLRAGDIVARESVVAGLDNAVDAFLGLFSGSNFGKMVVKI